MFMSLSGCSSREQAAAWMTEHGGDVTRALMAWHRIPRAAEAGGEERGSRAKSRVMRDMLKTPMEKIIETKLLDPDER